MGNDQNLMAGIQCCLLNLIITVSTPIIDKICITLMPRDTSNLLKWCTLGDHEDCYGKESHLNYSFYHGRSVFNDLLMKFFMLIERHNTRKSGVPWNPDQSWRNLFRCRIDLLKEATRIKSNVYFLDLVDLGLTYFGWCFKGVPFWQITTYKDPSLVWTDFCMMWGT